MDNTDQFTQKINDSSKFKLNESAKSAIKWIQEKIKSLFKSKKSDQLFTKSGTPQVGGMYLFVYDPKLKEILPFYDAYPLVMPIDFYNDGFLGLNLHYLPPLARAKMLDSLIKLTNDKELNEKSKINVSYRILKTYSNHFDGYQNCLKRYLYSHVRSSFHEVEIQDWNKAVMLPLQKWVINSNSKRAGRPPY